MKPALAIRASAAALALLGPSAALPADRVEAFGAFSVTDPYLRFWDSFGLHPELHGPPFPLDQFLTEDQSVVGFFDLRGAPWDPLADAAWVYANDTGRVRVFADSSNFHNPYTGPRTGREYRRQLEASLFWWKQYVKQSGDTAKFTVSASHLSVFHPEWYYPPPPGDVPPTPKDLPYAKLRLDIVVIRDDLPRDAPQAERKSEEFKVELWLVRDHDAVTLADASGVHAAGCVEDFTGVERFWLCEFGHDKGVGESVAPVFPLIVLSIDRDVTYSYDFLESLPYFGTIDLGWIPDGTPYTVAYRLQAEVGSYGNVENWTQAALGDPLDPGSGLFLEVTSPPAPAGKGPRLCDVEVDGARFHDNADGTVTDAYTGLMWQRCPAGFLLDDAGTPGDPGDDRCRAASTVSPTWQGALQYAAGDAFAGHLDWRLPNVKELDSIVELGCQAPAIEPDPFPDTPAEAFWTSTPGRDGAVAMAVSFFDGRILPAGMGSPGRLRLVRDVAPPSAALPGLRVGRPEPVAEPDAGTARMLFPVVLDRAAASDVTVRYRTDDESAHAGEDFIATSGTLVIPAGTRVAWVEVPILADALGEPPEAFYLALEVPSANARLAVAASPGTILDSQPRVEVAEANVLEGDGGSADLAFLVTLSKPSSVDTAVSYATFNGTAKSGDYTPASGAVTITAGLTSALVRVGVTGDTAVEGDEYLVLTLTDVSQNAALGPNASARGWIVDDDLPTAQALNDTGIGQCTNGSIFTSCPQAGWPGQDAESGRDVAANVPSDGYRGFSFTKLDAAGVPLADQTQSYATAPWSCVRDEVTALVWEVKTDDGGLHDRDWTYTWYNSTGIDDGGSPGTPAGGLCAGAAGCDTEKLVAAVNAAGWCGAADWRLPSREELRSLVVAKDGGFLYLGDPPLFPNAPGSHWTSTPSIDPTRARYFVGPIPTQGPKSTPQAARLVRGGI